MPTAVETIELRFLAKLEDVEKQIARLPGIGEKGAKKLVDEMAKQFARAPKEAERAAAKAAREWEQAFNAVDKAAKKTQFGGVFGDVQDLAEGAAASVKVVGTGLAVAGAAAAAGATGIVAWGAALHGTVATVADMIVQAEELLDTQRELEASGVFEPIDPAAAESVRTVTDAIGGLSTIVDRVTVVLASQWAPALDEAAVGAVKVGLAVTDLFQRFDIGTPILKTIAALFIGPNGVVLAEQAGAAAMKLVGDATSSYDDRARDLLGTIREQRIEERTAPERHKAEAAARKAQAEAERAYQQALRETLDAAKKQVDAQKTLQGVIDEAQATHLTDAEKINAKYDERLMQIAASVEAAHDADLVNKAIHENEMAREHELRTTRADAAREQRELILELDLLLQQAHEREKQRIASERAKRIDLALTYASTMGSTITSLAELELQQMQETGKATKEEILAGFTAVKAARRGEAVIQAAVNAVALTQALAWMGFGAPVAASGIALAQLATELAVIDAQKPPELHLGGRVRTRGLGPDESTHTLLDDEAVLNRRATRRLGDHQIDQLNRTGQMAGGGPMQLRMDYHGRALQTVWLGEAQRPGPLQGFLLDAGDFGQRNPYTGS
jgi:Holliday junction resolvasome RuvABC DNA-binding subunit